MNELETILEEQEKKSITISDRKFEIGKLSIKQVLSLIKKLGKIFINSSGKVKAISKDGKTNFDDVVAIVEALDENEVIELLGMLLNADVEFCSTISFEDTIEIIAIVCEQNDFKKIIKNFNRVAEATKKSN